MKLSDCHNVTDLRKLAKRNLPWPVFNYMDGGADDEVTFTPLLVVDDKGTAVTDRSKLQKMPVKAKVLGEVKGDKIDIFKYKNKTGYRRRQGHRQRYSQLEIVSITKPRAAKKKAADDDSKAEEA